jgi:hypothetical protein
MMLSSFAALGCSGRGAGAVPATYPADGLVTYKDGRPFTGGTIQFQPVGDSSFSVVGEIQENGSFTLHTIKNQSKAAGAVPGTYRVTITPPLPADHRPVQPIMPADTYQVEAKDNHFTLSLDPLQ